MRVESDRPTANGGWLHRTGELRPYVPIRRVERPVLDFHGMWKGWVSRTDPYHLDGFAMSLGLDTDCLRSLGCAWTGKAWAFPMKNAEARIIGIRLRDDQGRKWAVTGSKQGLFIPEGEPKDVLYILEGPTDTAAALTLGLHAIGRPSCMGCEEMAKAYVRRHRVRRIVIVTDNDAPGLRGAERLKASMPVLNCTYSPPCKDLREFVLRGGSRQLLEASLKDLVWQTPA
jgi:hypothetical protein